MKGFSMSLNYVIGFLLMIVLLTALTMMLDNQVSSSMRFLEPLIGGFIP